jgi:hypothetical protein
MAAMSITPASSVIEAVPILATILMLSADGSQRSGW